jgi:hypothetical protein
VTAIAQRFTSLCSYCNRLAEVQWQHDPGTNAGKYIWTLHPADPRQTLCVAALTTWKAQEGGRV